MAKAERKLTAVQLETLRRRLEDERQRILRLLRASGSPSSDGERSEPEETAQRASEETDRLRVVERERALLAEVERALAKVRSGTYAAGRIVRWTSIAAAAATTTPPA